MGEMDYKTEENCVGCDDEQLFLSEVIRGEHELLFLDTILRETFRNTAI